MNYIKSLTETDLCQLILQTKKELFLVMPLIQPQVLQSINQLYKNSNEKMVINLGMDFSPETFRQGYGEMEVFNPDQLKQFNCQNIQDNRISFIITDDTGFFLFIESRYLIPADKETINAVSIDPISIVRLKQHFFKTFEKKALEDQLANALIDESIRFKDVEQEFLEPAIINSNEINNTLIKKVGDDLKANPPIKPDFKRIVEYYSTKFQYVKLIFKGANLQTKKIELPKKALPLNDPALRKRLETKLNLFNSEDETVIFPELEALKGKIKQIREENLIPLKIREENLLDQNKKLQFEQEVGKLEKMIEKISEPIILKIEDLIEDTKNNLLKELISFYTENPHLITDNDLFIGSDKAYQTRVAKNKATEIIHKIKWPAAYELVGKMSLRLFYSNITKEDLSNKDLLDELIERGVINEADKSSLAVFGKGIDLKV